MQADQAYVDCRRLQLVYHALLWANTRLLVGMTMEPFRVCLAYHQLIASALSISICPSEVFTVPQTADLGHGGVSRAVGAGMGIYCCQLRLSVSIPKLPRSIIGNNEPIITYYRPSNNK